LMHFSMNKTLAPQIICQDLRDLKCIRFLQDQRA
jgi:hypothetical protein